MQIWLYPFTPFMIQAYHREVKDTTEIISLVQSDYKKKKRMDTAIISEYDDKWEY